MKINTNFAIYWNGEYIGEATELNIVKGNKLEMPMVDIKGNLQIKRPKK